MKIMVAEDGSMLGSGIERGLRLAGFNVDWVRDGKAAEAALRTVAYDLLLLDIGLPGKDGLQVLRWLRSQASRWGCAWRSLRPGYHLSIWWQELAARWPWSRRSTFGCTIL